MTETYTSLCEVIHNKYIVDSTFLEEPNVMKVQINGKPSSAECTLYRIDPNKEDPLPFFNRDIEGLKSMCDYIMLVDYQNKLYILLIELKRQGNSKAKKQLEATKVLFDYIIASAERVGKPINNCIHFRKIRIDEKKPKQRTQMGDIEYDENGYINYPWHDFYLRALLK